MKFLSITFYVADIMNLKSQLDTSSKRHEDHEIFNHRKLSTKNKHQLKPAIFYWKYKSKHLIISLIDGITKYNQG